MTGIIWACAATFIAACVPILAKVGTKKTDPALAGSIAGIVLCASIFFYRKDNIMGSSLIALGQRSVIFMLLAGLATGLFGICFFKSIHEGYTFQVTAIVKCSYIITLAAGFFLFHNTPDTFDYIAIALMIVGTVILNLDGTGILFALLAAVCASAAHILVSLGGIQLDKGFIAFWCVFIGMLVLIIFTIATGGMKKIRSMSFVDGICLILAGIAYPLAYDFYGRAVSMPGSYAGYIFNLTIIVMMICSSVILKEKISGKKFLGACIFIAALFVIACN